MKDGFKECPFCANEIKEGAKKCQYCHEFLDNDLIGGKKSDNIEEKNSIDENTKNQARPWYKNIGFYIVIGLLLLVIIYNIHYRIEQKNAKNKINNIYDTIIQQDGDVSNIDFDEYIDASKTAFSNRTTDKYFNQLQVIANNYNKDLDSIGDLFFEENYILKNTASLRELLSNWEKYKTANNKYESEVLKLIKDTEGDFGESSNKLKDAAIRISELVKSINRWADINIELYSYILDIQNDFYVDSNDEIIFYDGTNSIDKFNSLREKWAEESEIFDDAYNKYINYMVEYAENAKNGTNKSGNNTKNVDTSNNTPTYEDLTNNQVYNTESNNTITKNDNKKQEVKHQYTDAECRDQLDAYLNRGLLTDIYTKKNIKEYNPKAYYSPILDSCLVTYAQFIEQADGSCMNRWHILDFANPGNKEIFYNLMTDNCDNPYGRLVYYNQLRDFQHPNLEQTDGISVEEEFNAELQYRRGKGNAPK